MTTAELTEQLRELCLDGDANSVTADKIREQLEGQADGR